MTVQEQAAFDTIYESVFRAVIRGIDVINPPRKMTGDLKRAIRRAVKSGLLVKCKVDGRRLYRVPPDSQTFHALLVACAATGAAGLCDDDGKYELTPKTRQTVRRLLAEEAERQSEDANHV